MEERAKSLAHYPVYVERDLAHGWGLGQKTKEVSFLEQWEGSAVTRALSLWQPSPDVCLLRVYGGVDFDPVQCHVRGFFQMEEPSGAAGSLCFPSSVGSAFPGEG